MKMFSPWLLSGLFALSLSAQAYDESDPNLTDDTELEGRAVECQKCEATQSAPVDRDDDTDSSTP